jgi:hypothetical protein
VFLNCFGKHFFQALRHVHGDQDVRGISIAKLTVAVTSRCSGHHPQSFPGHPTRAHRFGIQFNQMVRPQRRTKIHHDQIRTFNYFCVIPHKRNMAMGNLEK